MCLPESYCPHEIQSYIFSSNLRISWGQLNLKAKPKRANRLAFLLFFAVRKTSPLLNWSWINTWVDAWNRLCSSISSIEATNSPFLHYPSIALYHYWKIPEHMSEEATNKNVNLNVFIKLKSIFNRNVISRWLLRLHKLPLCNENSCKIKVIQIYGKKLVSVGGQGLELVLGWCQKCKIKI